MAKRLGWTMLIGGALGVLAQILYDIWSTALAGSDLLIAQTIGSDVLVTMGIIGGVLGGLGLYRHLAARSTFGAGLPFSGFAFGIGENMISVWTDKERRGGFFKSVWKGLWLVIWFNVLVFAISFFYAGIVYYGFGVHDSSQFFWVQPLAESISGPLLYLTAFIFGGLVCCLWEVVIVLTKLPMPTILAIAWCMGCVLTPTGIMAWLGSVGGWGPDVMIMNGGQIIYNVAFMFFNGVEGAGFEFAALVLTVCCLFLTGLLCFLVHLAKFGRKPQDYRDAVEGGEKKAEVSAEGAAAKETATAAAEEAAAAAETAAETATAPEA